ncbi:unnamed protein product [Prunus armeniaca]|uniref:Uncharacterized protein n=1 Tax=Prunus armeniaca TaxID=36596 RepID=A0A6J5VTB4_PRUAR|nr:unnamed protein product [Prunus armeniaca]
MTRGLKHKLKLSLEDECVSMGSVFISKEPGHLDLSAPVDISNVYCLIRANRKIE